MKRIVFMVMVGCTPLQPQAKGNAEVICERYRNLGCEEGFATHAGASCEEVLVNLEQNSIPMPSTACVLSASSCEQARKCE